MRRSSRGLNSVTAWSDRPLLADYDRHESEKDRDEQTPGNRCEDRRQTADQPNRLEWSRGIKTSGAYEIVFADGPKAWEGGDLQDETLETNDDNATENALRLTGLRGNIMPWEVAPEVVQ